MKPQNSLILIEYVEETEKKTDVGVILPQSTSMHGAVDFLKSGKVLAVNRKEETEEHDIKVGDTVYFNINAKTLVPKHPDKILVRKEDIYMVM